MPTYLDASALALALLVLTLGYAVRCWVLPFGPCHRCDGTGRTTAPLGRVQRYCPRCDGTGRRLLIGRRVYNHFRSRRDAATRTGSR